MILFRHRNIGCFAHAATRVFSHFQFPTLKNDEEKKRNRHLSNYCTWATPHVKVFSAKGLTLLSFLSCCFHLMTIYKMYFEVLVRAAGRGYTDLYKTLVGR